MHPAPQPCITVAYLQKGWVLRHHLSKPAEGGKERGGGEGEGREGDIRINTCIVHSFHVHLAKMQKTETHILRQVPSMSNQLWNQIIHT